jgi:glycosyltransferase involved in cell wall biosynthesis
MWNGHRVSMIYPTYRETDSIRKAIIDCVDTGIIDEVVVVNNNAEPGTTEEVDAARAYAESRGGACRVLEIPEPRQGYGSALMRGIDETTAEYICLSEPDGTFEMRDVVKLIAYAQDYNIVFGSRTVKEFIWSGANMWWFLRWGNWAVAKMLEFLFNTNCLTDVGCTMRLVKSSERARIRPYLTVTGNFFGPQMMLVAALCRIPFVQVPVNYRARVGESQVTGSFWKAFFLGWRMIFLILEYWLGWVRHGGRFLDVRAARASSGEALSRARG